MFEAYLEPLGRLVVIGRRLFVARAPESEPMANGVEVDLDSIFDEEHSTHGRDPLDHGASPTELEQPR